MRRDLSEREMAVEWNFRMATPFMHKPFSVPPAEPERLEITDVGEEKKIIFYAENTTRGPIRHKRGVRQELFHLNMKSSRQLLHFLEKKTLPAQKKMY